VGGYRTAIPLAQYLRQAGHYLIETLYEPDRTLPLHVTALFLVALFVIAAVLRSRALVFSTLLLSVGILPMAFIPWRGLNAVYIPLAGLAIEYNVRLAFEDGKLRDVPASQVPLGPD
jgi:hypothetical protein